MTLNVKPDFLRVFFYFAYTNKFSSFYLMTASKRIAKNHIVGLLVLISVLAAAFFIRDWYVFYQCGAVESCLADSSYFQHYTKFAVTATITIIAFFVGKNSLCKRDHRILQVGMLTALCADACFKILHNAKSLADYSTEFSLLGICFFMIFQTIFIFRHTRKSDTDNSIPWIMVIPLLTLFIFNALIMFKFFGSALIPTVATYAAFLTCSLIVACKVSKVGYFPQKNATLIKRGMILFYIGDICVGLSMATGPDHSTQEIIATVANNFVWYLYVPALICLVLSGYKRSQGEQP